MKACFLCFSDACTNGIIPARGGASKNGVGGSSSEPEDEERKERVDSLAAVALAVVDQAIDNPKLFKGSQLICVHACFVLDAVTKIV